MSSTPAPEWMFITPHSAIDETRWHQLTQLLCQLFKASAGALAQYQDGDARLLSVKQNKNVGLTQGSIESVESLMSRLANPSLPSEGIWQHGLIQLPLYWPGGQMFGAVLLVCDRLPPNIETCQTLAAPIVDFMQAQLKLYRQAKQMERLSLQDDATQMLNSHGFNLMAPRQLNLSRRLGSHAGLVVMENGTQYQGHAKEDSMRALAQVVFDNLREADLAARVDDQIILLAFVDSEANLDSLVTRLRKQFARKLEPQRVLTGHSFFTPDSHLGLTPMLAQANEELQATRARLYPKAVLADNKELPASAPINIPSPDDSPANVSIEPTESTEVMAEASKATEEYSENSGDMPLQQDSLEQTSNEQATMPPAIGNDEPATETKTAAVNEEQDVDKAPDVADPQSQKQGVSRKKTAPKTASKAATKPSARAATKSSAKPATKAADKAEDAGAATNTAPKTDNKPPKSRKSKASATGKQADQSADSPESVKQEVAAITEGDTASEIQPKTTTRRRRKTSS